MQLDKWKQRIGFSAKDSLAVGNGIDT